jgi:hypothetical protein
VAALYRLSREFFDNDGELRLFGPAGLVADMVLSLVELAHHTRDPDEQPA